MELNKYITGTLRSPWYSILAHFCFISLILQTSLGLVHVWKYWFSHVQLLDLYVIDLVTFRNQLAIFWISVKWITWRNRQKCEGRKFSEMPFQTYWNVQLWRLTIINLGVDVWQWQLQQGANGKVEMRLKMALLLWSADTFLTQQFHTWVFVHGKWYHMST